MEQFARGINTLEQDKRLFAKRLADQWAARPLKKGAYDEALQYINAIAAFGSYSIVFHVPDRAAADILRQYGLLEE